MNWERYRTHINLVVKFRKRSNSEYLRKTCTGSGNSKDFWSAVKPLFSQNVKSGNDTVLIENDKLVKYPESVANIMNSYLTWLLI